MDRQGKEEIHHLAGTVGRAQGGREIMVQQSEQQDAKEKRSTREQRDLYVDHTEHL
eukprot:c9618_g1_i1 orf=155-322(-)